jgi:hypothetical protein
MPRLSDCRSTLQNAPSHSSAEAEVDQEYSSIDMALDIRDFEPESRSPWPVGSRDLAPTSPAFCDRLPQIMSQIQNLDRGYKLNAPYPSPRGGGHEQGIGYHRIGEDDQKHHGPRYDGSHDGPEARYERLHRPIISGLGYRSALPMNSILMSYEDESRNRRSPVQSRSDRPSKLESINTSDLRISEMDENAQAKARRERIRRVGRALSLLPIEFWH